MPVSDQKVLMKMMKELQQAIENVHDAGKMKGHVHSVRMLADLLIDEESTTDESVVLTTLKQSPAVENPSTYKREEQQKGAIDHDGANGSSIFDF